MSEAERLDTTQWRRIDALLAQALDLPSEARDAWLAALPDADRPYADLLRGMLNRDGGVADDFLRRPVTASTLAAVGAELDAETAGRTVGPYTLVRELGAGGMGTVWLARRTDGAIRRPVALKLPRYGWARGVEARLQAERESLASLEHPNIARLYDAGTTPGGRPYFAMEYVDGLPIDEYVAKHASTVDECLRLFLQVAAAVSHAHARLIVHRDLKPSNVIVTPDGAVRLLDFGAAKLLAPGDTGPSDLTREAGGALSPAYAAPEYVRGEPITVATDVYSLGVVLFELLTGRRPFSRTPADVRRFVDAPAPRASQSVAKDPVRARELRGDLDAILAKALADEPTSRYASVDAMAEDVRRHLAGEPVQARRVTAWYLASRFVARHRAAVALSAAAVVALVVALGLAIWQARLARDEAARAERVTAFVGSIFSRAPRNGVGGAVTAVDVLRDASRRIDTELTNDPAAAARIGTIVGQSLDDLGVPQGIEALMHRTVEHARRAWGREDPRTLHAEVLLAQAEASRDADAALRRLDALVPTLRAAMPGTAADTVEALRLQSFVRARLNRRDDSYAALDEAIAIAEREFGPLDERTLWLLGLRSNTYGRFGEYRRQLKAAEEALRRTTTAFGAQRPHIALIAMERWYADALRANGRPGDAARILRRVLEDQKALDAAVTVRVVSAKYALANALVASGRLDEGLAGIREVLALERVQNPAETDDRRAYTDGLANALMLAWRLDEAWTAQLEAEAIASRLGNDMLRMTLQRELRRARLLAMGGRAGEAEAAVANVLPRIPPDAPALLLQARLVEAQNARFQRRPREALRFAELPTDAADPSTRAVRAALAAERALARLDLGDLPGARRDAATCARELVEAQVEPSVASSTCAVAGARVALADGHAAEAQALLRPVSARWAETNPDSPAHGDVLLARAEAEGALGDAAAARTDRRRAIALLRRSRLPAFRAQVAGGSAAAPAVD